jgi:STE24 endopeptidase
MELQLWVSGPAHPAWRLRAYLSFMFRHHVLIILLPMIPIVMANDLTRRHAAEIRNMFGVVWADQAVLVGIAGVVFAVAPVMLRFVWHTQPLPAGPLRRRLEALCQRIGLAYRRILIWKSEGMVVNAAVMGLFRPVRYILLSDGLLEMMDDDHIEAVFGHEAGHIRRHHIFYYLMFAVLSMLIVGAITELALWSWPDLFARSSVAQDYFQVAAMALIVLVWVFGFGFISRRFEWQADVFGAFQVTPSAEGCRHPCLLHGTASLAGKDPKSRKTVLCASAAERFATALERIAALNGIPAEARSWRHSSIAHRVQRLRSYAVDPRKLQALQCSVVIIKAILWVGVVAGSAGGLWLYWPT